MKRLAVALVCASLLAACATGDKDGISSLDDPKFVSWYKAATYYAPPVHHPMRSAGLQQWLD